MKVLVTGNAGFIGRHVVAGLLANGHEVVGMDLRNPDSPHAGEVCLNGDLLDGAGVLKAFTDQRPEALIHLAAKTSMKTIVPGDRRFAVNIVGQKHLMDAVRECGTVKRAIYTSTKYVFRGPPPAPHRSYRPDTSYGESKAEMEELIWRHDGGGCDWAIVRPTTIWGPGMGTHYRSFLEMVRTGRYVNLGSRGARKDLGYVANVAWQYARLLELPADRIARRVLYVGDYDAWNLHEWADAFRGAFGARKIPTIPMPLARIAGRAGDLLVRCGRRKFPFTSFRLKNLTEDDLCDMAPTQELCGPLPFSREEAVAATVRWYLDGLEKGERK